MPLPRMEGAPMTTKPEAGGLIHKNCVPCRGGVRPLKGEAVGKLLREVNDWDAVEEHHLVKGFRFKNFRTALDFVNGVGELAEQEWHHPDLALAWGKVDIKIYTHKIDGLSQNDFILAAKIDRLYSSAAGRKPDGPK